MLALDFQSYLVDDILVKIDRASMGVALEVRAPWLDVNIIEYAFREIPDGWKVRNAERRRIQARLAHKLLPNILDTKRKQGFSIPLFSWFQDQKIQTTIREWLYDSPLNDYVKEKSVEKLLRGISADRHNESRVFALCMAGLSMKYF
jgi:asparagine synthase (glutamine-hydrolysing)